MTFQQFRRLLQKKALQSISRNKVSALGLNKEGVVVAKACNRPRFDRKGGGVHAEMLIMKEHLRKGIKTILICRVNGSGQFLPISPCRVCKEKAEELGIQIVSI